MTGAQVERHEVLDRLVKLSSVVFVSLVSGGLCVFTSLFLYMDVARRTIS